MWSFFISTIIPLLLKFGGVALATGWFLSSQPERLIVSVPLSPTVVGGLNYIETFNLPTISLVGKWWEVVS